MSRPRELCCLVTIAAAACAGHHHQTPPAAGPPPALPALPVAKVQPASVVMPTFPDKRFSVSDYGARGDGQTNDTAAIERAIEACHEAGGGTVVIPAGTFMSTSLKLESHVRLYLSAGATLAALPEGFGPPEPNAYDKYQDFGHSHFHNALLWGEGLTDVAVEGEGTIDGSGLTRGTPKGTQGDKQIALKSCDRVLFRGLTQLKGGHFFYLLTDCHNLTMDGLKLRSGRDAIDLVGCSHVNVHDVSALQCGDDTIALKADFSLGRQLDSEDVSVWSCEVETNCNGLQFGSETAGNFRHVRFANIEVRRAGKAGIGIQTNDGAVIEDVRFESIHIHNAVNPIFINTTRRMRRPDSPGPGHVQQVVIRDVVADSDDGIPQQHASVISGVPGVPHQDITLENVTLIYKGGGHHSDADVTPPYPSDYNPRSLGPRPAYAFYIRHARGLHFHNVRVGYHADDLRPALVATDVDGLDLDGVTAQRAAAADAWPSLRLDNVRGLRIQNAPQLQQ